MAPEYDDRYAAAKTASIDVEIKAHQDAIKALRETKKQYAPAKTDADSE
jgi:hypothetical protein